jgi:histidine triad (HIT) family protein
MLTPEQTSALKRQLQEHIEKSFPEDKKEYAKEQIENMNSRELEEFLAKNNLVAGQNSQCVFCSIVFGDIPSYRVDENPEAIAVLEINPISRGHMLVIPKKHLKEGVNIPKDAEKLAKTIAGRIKSKLKPKRIDTTVSSMFGHHVINILPIYADETFSSKRQPAKKEELEEVEKLLKTKPASSKPKAPKQKKSELKKAVEMFEKKLWLPQRIP